jgi:hypothetical protein
MPEISGNLSPKDIQAYKQEFAEGAKLFQDSLQEYSKTDEFHKKEQLKKVMSEALHVMDEIANDVFKQKKLQSKEQKLAADYDNFTNNDTSQTIAQLNKDISDIQKSV